MKLLLKIVLLLLLPSLAQSHEISEFLKERRKEADSLVIALNNNFNDSLRIEICMQLAYYFNEVERDNSFYYSSQALLLAQKSGNKLQEVKAYESSGNTLNQLGNYPKSLVYILNGIRIAEDLETKKGSRQETEATFSLSLLYSGGIVPNLIFRISSPSSKTSSVSEIVVVKVLEPDGMKTVVFPIKSVVLKV